MLYQLSDKGL